MTSFHATLDEVLNTSRIPKRKWVTLDSTMSVFHDINPDITQYAPSFSRQLSKISDLTDLISKKTMFITNDNI